MTAETAARFKIAVIENTAMRVVVNGVEVTVSAHEIDPFHSTLDQVTDYALSELRKLRDRLNSFADVVHDHNENGGFPADFPVARELERHCTDHIRLTRRYWRTVDNTYRARCLQVSPRTARQKEQLAQVAWARVARVQIHLKLTREGLCPPIVPLLEERKEAEPIGLRPKGGGHFSFVAVPIKALLSGFARFAPNRSQPNSFQP
ncbi:hypothetical protein [Agrobacterium tumefaciens]|uniref:hypothetical protein n=1 Tax=Agrobacterium tumefaciens TaxID=358 RepID=UPI0022052941|nr:hypothetical protein FY128_26870 [Agrobacterium tumefaciens]